MLVGPRLLGSRGPVPGSTVVCGPAYTDCHQAARALGAQGLLLSQEKKNQGVKEHVVPSSSAKTATRQ